jgi:hypothetical protein
VFEELAGNPSIGLAASDYGAMLVLFASHEQREASLELFPLTLDGSVIKLERPEDGPNRFGWRFSSFAQLAATGFPLEHWSDGGIHATFSSIGSVCCIDPICLNRKDFSAVRLVIKRMDTTEASPVLLVCDALAGSSTEVRIRTVHDRPWDGDSSSPHAGHFEAWAGFGNSPFPGDVPLGPCLSDIDEFSLPGEAPPSPGVARQPVSSVLNLWSCIVARHQAGMACAAALDNIDGVPLDDGFP